MRKILVTGGLGFVGSNLVDKLVSNNQVWVIDDLSSESSSKEYINPKANYIFKSIIDILEISELENINFDVVFHLAAKARIQPSFEDPVTYFDTNSLGTIKLLEYARKSSVKSFIYITTSSKNHKEGKFLTPYTFSKVIGEEICKLYSDIYNMNISLATFYNVYGPREPKMGEWATVVAKFERQLINGESLTVVGDGEQMRDFTHVSDICDGLIEISKHNFKFQNFDLGRGEPTKIIDLARMLSNNIVFVNKRINEGDYTNSNWEKTESLIGWRAKHNLKDYIEKIKQMDGQTS